MTWSDLPCVITTNSRTKDGYGRTCTKRFGRIVRKTHQLAWIDAHGRWPAPGMQLNHYCDTPPCMEPTHLWEGTQAENNRDSAAKGRHAGQKKTHCKHDHEFTPENTYINPKGHRYCRECQRATSRANATRIARPAHGRSPNATASCSQAHLLGFDS